MIKRPIAFGTVVFIVFLTILQLCFPNLFRTQIPQNIEKLDGKTLTLFGNVKKITSSERYGKKTTTVQLEEVYLSSSTYSKKYSKKEISKITDKNQSIICYLSTEENLKLGNPVLIRGEVKFFQKARNPGGFDFETYYLNKGILFSLRNCEILKKGEEFHFIPQMLYEFRLRSEKILERYLSKGQASIMKVLLLGEKEKLDEETKMLYQKNGIAHILSISGLHISMIGMGIFLFLSFLQFSMPYKCGCSIGFLFLFGLMVGFTPSTVRAVFMFSMMLLSKILKRSYDMITALAVAAVLLILQKPVIIQDCSFQLSFTAIVGIAFIYPSFRNMIQEGDDLLWHISFEKIFIYRVLKCFLNAVAPSLAVTLTTAPILIYYFHEISFLSILLNLIILPFMALLLGAGMFMILIANIFWNIYTTAFSLDWKIQLIEFFEKMVSFLIAFILELYRKSCIIFQAFPFGRFNVETPELWEIVCYYLLLILATIIVNKKRHIYQFWICSLLMTFLFWPPNREFSIWNLDVGQGDCNVIFTKEGRTFIIDCGSTSQKDVGKYVLIPFLKSKGCNKIDGIFVSHLDQDHWNGITELLKYSEQENLPVERIYFYEKDKEQAVQIFSEETNMEERTVLTLSANAVLQDGDLSIRCLYPFKWQEGLKGNDASMVLKFEYKNFEALFMGDLEKEGEDVLLRELKKEKREKILNSDYLKVGHHGSNSSSYEDFLFAVGADIASISAGKENPYGHPHKDLIQRLKDQKLKFFRTDENGAIQIKIENNKIIVSSYL